MMQPSVWVVREIKLAAFMNICSLSLLMMAKVSANMTIKQDCTSISRSCSSTFSPNSGRLNECNYIITCCNICK